jgi:NitT/TauT family transport system ATP-binding protein
VIVAESHRRATGPAQPALPTAIEAIGIGHTYRGRDRGALDAIESIDLRIAAGGLVALLGPSGCGKSTLLRILSGLIQPTRGAVTLAGAAPADARSKRGIGWLAQDDGLLPWLNVTDNIGLPGRVGRRRSALRQRAALARALVALPALLFLDEPFASLDEITRERLGDLLLDVRAASRPTTVLVTHSVVEAVRLADRVIVLSPRPARVVADVEIGLERPRRYDQPEFGPLVQSLKADLAANGTGRDT